MVIVCVRFGGGGLIKGVEGKGYLAGDRVWGCAGHGGAGVFSD